jgi:L-methionine (R)-S-oxide reductase
MADTLSLSQANDKTSRYEELMPQLAALIADERDVVANLANVCAALKTTFDFFWVGFYRVDQQQLVLGPFQGPIACTRIGFGKGVCGAAWSEKRTQLVEDVDQFPGHIACSSASRSEIVVPIIKQGQVMAVLDVDSDQLADFDAIDAHWLEQLALLLSAQWHTD